MDADVKDLEALGPPSPKDIEMATLLDRLLDKSKNPVVFKSLLMEAFLDFICEDEEAMDDPVKNEDGSLKNFTIRMPGETYLFRCECGCNVFTKPYKDRPLYYACNGCPARYVGSD